MQNAAKNCKKVNLFGGIRTLHLQSAVHHSAPLCYWLFDYRLRTLCLVPGYMYSTRKSANVRECVCVCMSVCMCAYGHTSRQEFDDISGEECLDRHSLDEFVLKTLGRESVIRASVSILGTILSKTRRLSNTSGACVHNRRLRYQRKHTDALQDGWRSTNYRMLNASPFLLSLLCENSEQRCTFRPTRTNPRVTTRFWDQCSIHPTTTWWSYPSRTSKIRAMAEVRIWGTVGVEHLGCCCYCTKLASVEGLELKWCVLGLTSKLCNPFYSSSHQHG